MLKLETLTELENLTDFDTIYEIISMQALKYCPYYTREYCDLLYAFESIFPTSKARMIYDLLNVLEQFELYPKLDILNRPSLAVTLAEFYSEDRELHENM